MFHIIVSDMDLTSFSLGSKETLSCINNVFKNFVTSIGCILECVRRVN